MDLIQLICRFRGLGFNSVLGETLLKQRATFVHIQSDWAITRLGGVSYATRLYVYVFALSMSRKKRCLEVLMARSKKFSTTMPTGATSGRSRYGPVYRPGDYPAWPAQCAIIRDVELFAISRGTKRKDVHLRIMVLRDDRQTESIKVNCRKLIHGRLYY